MRPTIVGRAAELAELAGSLEEALRGDGQMVLIRGSAGMGKTRLVEWLRERAAERAALVARARSWEGVETPPYWPWIQVLRQILGDAGDTSAPLEKSLGVLAGIVPPLRAEALREATVDRFTICDAVAAVVRNVAASRPLVLIFDDVDAADEASLLLLQFVAREVADHPILITATCDEMPLHESSRSSRILRDVARAARVVQLRRLDEEAVAELYASIAGVTAENTIVQALLRATEGNPLFIEETVHMLMAEGDLHRADHSTGFRVPTGIRDIIRRRLEAFSDETFTLLAIASVLGREFDVTAVSSLSDVPVENVLELLEQPCRDEVIREVGALGRYAFSHVLIRETLYEGLTAAQRMRLHRRAAELLEELPDESRRARLAEAAHHWFKAAQAGDPAKALSRTLEAAENAAAVDANDEALRLYRRALKLVRLGAVGRDQVQAIEGRIAQLEGPQEPVGQGAAPAANQFKREGEYWTVTFGGTTARLKDSKGLRFLARLLAEPGSEVHVLDLIAAVEPPGPQSVTVAREDALAPATGDAGTVLDATAKAAYRRRLEGLQEDIDEARLFNDSERVARLERERESLITQLAQAVGLGGRDRRVGSAAERARVSVTKTIKDALQKIARANPPLHEHLASTVRTGTYCSYMPDPRVPIEWEQ